MSPTQFDTPKALPQVVISHWRRLPFARTAALLVISMALASAPARADIVDAAATCDPAQLRAELAAGSDANAVDEDGNTVLHWAARNSGDACVEILIEHVSDLDARNNDGETALMKAAISSVSEPGALRSVQLLIDARADPSIPNRFGYSSLFALVVYGSGMMLMIPPSELQLDPETGIPPFKDIEYEKAKLLLDNGANPNEIDTHGQPLIQFAVEQRTPALIDLLVSRGADLTVLAPSNDHSMLHIAALRDRAISIPYLLKQGLDINGRNALGATPLMLAAANSSMKSMSALLEAGADTDVADNEGITPLLYVTREQNREALQALLENGANPDAAAPATGNTALQFAAYLGWFDGVQLLLTNGADPQLPNNEGLLPRDAAELQGHRQIVDLLNDNQAQAR